MSYLCATCGKQHDELPLSFGADAPDAWHVVPPGEREARCDLTADVCVIDGREFFQRGCIEVPVVHGSGPIVWGVWVSISQESLKRAAQVWEQPGRENQPPYFGWLCTSLPGYPETLLLKTMVHTRPVGQRPWIELEPTDHPLAVDQRNGITAARAQEIAHALMELQNGKV